MKWKKNCRGDTHHKDAIEALNAPTLLCCCFYCYIFSAVAATMDICVKINSTTKFLTKNKYKNIGQISANLYGT